ncbi:hypothetical protein BKA70DRAFT_1152429 [Coprinopsis sp. MPI-PUGE-AT-0042]|nr:hypothetical protein BKA70DRAFT_1152429 [Coprinopsis sp. MPI-PUGE-AT-0042]
MSTVLAPRPLSPPPARLPIEILDIIADSLSTQGCVPALRLCALASKELAVICQKRLFASIQLIHTPQHQVPIGIFGYVYTQPTLRFQRCLSRNPILGAYVRELEISCTFTPIPGDDEGFDVLQILGNVQTFTFGFSDGNRSSGSQMPWSSDNRILTHVKDAVLSFVNRNPITSLSLFGIRDFPSTIFQRVRTLQSLRVQHVSLDQGPHTYDQSLSRIKLNKVELLQGTVGLAQALILDPAPLFDITQATRLHTSFGMRDPNHLFAHLIPLLDNAHFLEVDIEVLALAGPLEMWTEGRMLSMLKPSSLRVLHTVKVRVIALPGFDNFPIFGRFVAELAHVAGRNILRAITIETQINCDCTIAEEPSEWASQLDNVLSSGFPHLRKLHLKMEHCFFSEPNPWEAAENAQKEWEDVFSKRLVWCAEHLDLTYEAEGIVA